MVRGTLKLHGESLWITSGKPQGNQRLTPGILRGRQGERPYGDKKLCNVF